MATQMSPGAVRVIDPVLSTIARGYRNANFISRRLFPRVPVLISGGQILQFNKEAFRTYNSRRAPGSGTRRVQFGYEGKPFALENHSLEGQVPREHQRDASVTPGVDLAERAVNLVMRTLELGLEIQSADLATDAAAYPTGQKKALTSTAKWSHDDSNPTKEVCAAKEVVREIIGIEPNLVVLSAKAFDAAKNNPSIIDRIKYTGRDSVTPQLLAGLWDVEEVVVGKGVKSNDQNVMSDIWGNTALVAYVPANPIGREEPSFAYTYEMEGHPLVEQPYYDNNSKSWVYPVAHERTPVIAGIEAGFLLTGVK